MARPIVVVIPVLAVFQVLAFANLVVQHHPVALQNLILVIVHIIEGHSLHPIAIAVAVSSLV